MNNNIKKRGFNKNKQPAVKKIAKTQIDYNILRMLFE